MRNLILIFFGTVLLYEFVAFPMITSRSTLLNVLGVAIFVSNTVLIIEYIRIKFLNRKN